MLTRLLTRYKLIRGDQLKNGIDAALNRVYLNLYQLQVSRSFIEIQLDGDNQVYQSMILSLDPLHRNVLIDELFPTGFIGMPGQKMQVRIRQKAGRKITFQSVILERHVQNQIPLYVIEMPSSIDDEQRRNAYRLPVSTSLAIESRFIAPDDHPCIGQIRNLSTNGVCIEVQGADIKALARDDQLTSVEFDFAGINIGCDLAVRNVEATNADLDVLTNRWVIGAEYVDLSQQVKHVLEKSIMRIQRDRIKFTGDMEVKQALA